MNVKWKTLEFCVTYYKKWKHNWNKDMFRVYLGHHLKEVAISWNPHLNFLQIAWTKNKTDIKNWTAASKTTYWLQNGCK
jgi:hypothetical protein